MGKVTPGQMTSSVYAHSRNCEECVHSANKQTAHNFHDNPWVTLGVTFWSHSQMERLSFRNCSLQLISLFGMSDCPSSRGSGRVFSEICVPF